MDRAVIERVLNNRGSAAEAEAVAEWLATEEGSAYLSERMMQEAATLPDQQAEEWIDHYVELKGMEQRLLSSIKRRRRMHRYLLVAAVVLPLCIFGGFSLFLAQRAGLFVGGEPMEVVTACGEQARIVLQDGTTVHLNAGSRLEYPRVFSLFERKITLDGEAHVTVRRERLRPFFVELADSRVKVTGTEFNVKAYSADSFVRILLTEGQVALIDPANKTYTLRPGQQAELDRGTRNCQITTVEEPSVAMVWRQKGLGFYRAPLHDVLRTMERQYGITFEVADAKVLDYRFTYTGERVEPEAVLRELERVSRVRFVKVGARAFKVTEARY